MRTLDRYDYIGFFLLSLLAVVWGLHFVLPAPPPEPPVPGIAPGITLPGNPFPR